MKKQTPALLQSALQNQINAKPSGAAAVPKKNSLLLSSTTALMPGTAMPMGITNNAMVDRARSIPSSNGSGMLMGAYGTGPTPPTQMLGPAAAVGGPLMGGPVSTPEDKPVVDTSHPMPPPELLQNVQWHPEMEGLLSVARVRAMHDPNDKAAADTYESLAAAKNKYQAFQTLHGDPNAPKFAGVPGIGGVLLPAMVGDPNHINTDQGPETYQNMLRGQLRTKQAEAKMADAQHKIDMENATVPSHMTRRKQNIAMGILLIAAALGADPRYMNEVTSQWVQSIQELDAKDLDELHRKMQADYEKVQAGQQITEQNIADIFGKVTDMAAKREAQAKTTAKATAMGIEEQMRLSDADHAAQMAQEAADRKQKDELAKIEARNAKLTNREKDILDLMEGRGLSYAQASDIIDSRNITDRDMRAGKVEGQNLTNQKRRIELKWLEPKLKADIDKLTADAAKARSSGDKEGERVSFAQRRLILSEQMAALKKEQEDLAALIASDPQNMPKYAAKMAEVEGKIKEIRDFFTQMTQEALGKTPPKADAPNSGAKVSFAAPVAGPITSRRGPRNIGDGPMGATSTDHGGDDIGVPAGTKVKAAAAGVVERVEKNVGKAGNIVVIRHADGSSTHYFHLSGFDVKAGDTVKQGQLIARSGKSGNAKGPHLHFEIRDASGNKLNPSQFVKYK